MVTAMTKCVCVAMMIAWLPGCAQARQPVYIFVVDDCAWVRTVATETEDGFLYWDGAAWREQILVPNTDWN